MNYEIRKIEPSDELYHHGILGQRWGIRRFQYRDGSLTDEGRKRYGSLKESISKWTIRRKQKQTEKQEAAEKEKLEKQEADKRKLIEYGSIDEIKKNLDTFSPSEMTEIRNRFATELQVREQINKLVSIDKPVSEIIKPEKVSKGTKYIAENITNLSKAATQANLFYNQVTKASNTLLGTSRRLIV